MPPSGPDASNACLPAAHPVISSVPPVPKGERGERTALDGKPGRLNAGKSIVAYTSGKNVVIRNLTVGEPLGAASKVDVLVYRGHKYFTSSVKLSPSGAFVASGDSKGCLRIWAYDHEEHLVKYDCFALTSVVRDIDWDFESKRVAIGGERDGSGSAACAVALQWDTGVSVGQLAQHLKGRCASVSFKPSRPFKLVTAGKDDTKTNFHKGPPFAKVPSDGGVPSETAHSKGAVYCVRYNSSGTLAVSVGTDRSLCVYEGKEFKLLIKVEGIHSATIYCVAWSDDDKSVMTASGDGTCKLFAVSDSGDVAEQGTWNPAEFQLGKSFSRVPVGGNQLGCSFVGGQPLSVGLNGQMCLLPSKPSGTSDIQVITGHYAAIAGMAVDYSAKKFYTGDTDGILCEWDLMTAKPIGRLEPPEGNDDLMFVTHGGAISGLAMATKSKTMYSVGWDDKCFTTKNGKVEIGPLSLGAQPSAVAAGSELAVICTVNGLQLVRDKSLSDLISIPFTANAACVTKDDKTVYVGGDDNKIHIFGVNDLTLTETGVIDAHLKPVQCLELSHDESKLASSDERDVCVFDLSEGNKAIIGKGRWCFHAQRVTCLSWSNDDSMIASAGADDSIYVWSFAKKSRRVHYQFAHRGGVTGLAFLPTTDGSHKFVTVGIDSVVNLWDATADIAEKFA
eukprot:CAMPEP_0168751604 /NCGR_PEP_ID=MMETSP0724-20121128/17923_1 /TAXON_ID=265536 /ORGANISM="Amphiprora sp., Strain CCMP467" /LENGTH=674 /DNA_ID=CAMNT_0008799761 /DNA_START=63 /DNA_END=2087 /DNA_ORIENTATION=+